MAEDEKVPEDPLYYPDTPQQFREEVTAFIRERCNGVCPHCGQQSWILYDPPPDGLATGFSLHARKGKDRATSQEQYHQVAAVACTNCGYMRLHNLFPFYTWRTDRAKKQP